MLLVVLVVLIIIVLLLILVDRMSKVSPARSGIPLGMHILPRIRIDARSTVVAVSLRSRPDASCRWVCAGTVHPRGDGSVRGTTLHLECRLESCDVATDWCAVASVDGAEGTTVRVDAARRGRTRR